MSAADTATSMVARVALIMNVFDEPGRRLRLDQVVTRTGLPRSSVHRILKQLESAGLFQRRPDGYCLAASPLPRTQMVDHSQLRGAASRTLERLHADTGLVVHLGVLFGRDVVYLDKVAGRSGVLVPTRVAGHTPAHASALGKAMLAQLPAEEVDAVVGERLEKRTRATIANLATLHQELARIRSRHGLAYDTEELAIGLCSVAAPIRTSDDGIAGLSLTGAVPMNRLQRTAPFVLRAARRISQQLGGTDPEAAVSGSQPTVSDTDSMLSRVLRTLTSDAWV
ncbi:IclR family transcriptional regulator [Mycobacterium branderi]|uniref:Transcriptional regulator n=1 Tax=Mycobacterium branderi TaxID=43348 RepID=A0A7I7W532_9MYCO|nr:IclR family transcriptional regulator [Mycobacterium branderi]ORA39519.1 IclR family transcriptional regulator [Mycobacterium branderi]BBZ11925.1 transcriptional regulator [Mycobacterium branderi]